MFLALDSVFGQCSVAVVTSTGEVLCNEVRTGKREQTQQILPMIQSALQASGVRAEQLTALIFNRGPGAFSGIRINTAVVQALAVAHDLPCVGVSSLQVLAQAAYHQLGVRCCYAAHDARMQQVYLGAFRLNGEIMMPYPQAIESIADTEGEGAECLLDYDKTTSLSLPVVGDGAALLSLAEDQPAMTTLNLDAAILAQLGSARFAEHGGTAAHQALPVYLRNHAWKTLKEQGKA